MDYRTIDRKYRVKKDPIKGQRRRKNVANARVGEVARKTKETDVTARIDLDGKGKSKISTGIHFFDHMLTLFAKHGLFDLEILCKGDIEVDGHHTVEDVGIALGEALNLALAKKEG